MASLDTAASTSTITLNPLDYIPPRNYVRVLFPFPLDPGVEYSVVYDDLQKSLRKTFVQEPWASGKIFRQPTTAADWRPGQFEIRFQQPDPAGDGPPPHQLHYHELDTDWSYSELREAGFPSEVFPEETLLLAAPRLGDVDADGGADVLLAQANFLPGGLLLALTTCHAATDGAGMVGLLKLWGENFRELHGRDREGQIAASPFTAEDHDRALPDRIWERTRSASGEAGQQAVSDDDPWLRGLVCLDSDYPGDDMPGMTTRPSDSLQPPGVHAADGSGSGDGRGRMLNRIMFLSAHDLAALKTECASFVPAPSSLESPSESPSPLTVSDAINALLWRTLLRARVAAATTRSPAAPPMDPISVFESPVDIRSTFGPGFPAHYLGNCFLLNTARMPLADLIAPATPLGLIAHALRQNAARLTPDAVQAAYGVLRATSDLSCVRGRFVERVDSSDLLVSNIMAFPVREIDFGRRYGSGVPQALRVLHGQYAPFVRLAHILPISHAHGGVEISINLFEDEMGFFDQDDEALRFLVPVEV
ncbi:uncharacterized protein BJX67DRAFT_377792 [Aspergillus lucknowensis]|uniref:Trichothecene 3-O-acetyltransferase-like N-terminal domain-containing protein n=1 Tax=Aspergillus lucknowensis TaxID=176173 RepID=A0ABR4M3M1_9EURO